MSTQKTKNSIRSVNKHQFIKRSTAAFLCVVMMLFAVLPAFAAAPDVRAKAFVLIDADTGEILHEKNADTVLVPASMTKLMTLYLVLENISKQNIRWTDQVKISAFSNKVSRQSSLSSFPLPTGALYTVQELFYATAINSSNAGAIALAEHIGGTEGRFVDMMNQRAKSFGLEDVKFVNSSGLNNADLMGEHPPQMAKNEDTKLSAKSMVTIAYRLLNDYPEYEAYSSLTRKIIREGQNDQIIINATNRMLPGNSFAMDGARGLKTGYTFNAGYCFAGFAVRSSGRFLSVVMGAETTEERFRGSARLLQYGFDLAEGKTVRETGEDGGAEPVRTFLYPDKLNGYVSSANGKDPKLAPNNTTTDRIADCGDLGFGVMNNGKMDMVMINGQMYCVSPNGRVYELENGSGVGKAALTFFNRDDALQFDEGGSLSSLRAKLSDKLDTESSNYCFKIEASFQTDLSQQTTEGTGAAASNREQVKGYDVKNGSGRGTIIGFWNCGNAPADINEGFTFYYLDENKKVGGLLEEAEVKSAVVYIDRMDSVDAFVGGGEPIPITWHE